MTAVTAPSATLALALVVAVAGGIGAVARALVIHHVSRRRTDPLPLGTMVVNASGSLLLGVLTGLTLYHGQDPRVVVVADFGFCGGYTTWSTAAWETLHLVRSDQHREAVIYTFGGLAACLAAAAVGLGVVALF